MAFDPNFMGPPAPKKNGLLLELLPYLIQMGAIGGGALAGGGIGAGAAAGTFAQSQAMSNKMKQDREDEAARRAERQQQIALEQERIRQNAEENASQAELRAAQRGEVEAQAEQRKALSKPAYVDEKGNLRDRLPDVPIPSPMTGEVARGINVGPQMPMSQAIGEAKDIRQENRLAEQARSVEAQRARTAAMELAGKLSEHNPEAAGAILKKYGFDLPEMKAKPETEKGSDTTITQLTKKKNSPEGLTPAESATLDSLLETQKALRAVGPTIITQGREENQRAGRAQSIANQFDNEQIVKKFNVASEAARFVKTLDPKTANPADDQALIYAFAKAMDPDSVVREGEYATVQKYSQSWMEKFGFDAKRVMVNSAFLTPEARANIKKTIESKVVPIAEQYRNLHKEYGRRIDKMTGQNDGTSYLTDYGGAFEEPPPPPPQPKTDPSGVRKYKIDKKGNFIK